MHQSSDNLQSPTQSDPFSKRDRPRFSSRSAARLIACMLVMLACFRIASTCGQLSQTYDEPFHVLRGMHWITGHEYVHTEHPPLGPAVFALLPAWLNFEYLDIPNRNRAGNAILADNGDYLRTLACFRVGNLLYLCLCCGVLFWWAERRSGSWVAVLAVAWLTFCPVILAHAGLATTDMPLTATLLLAMVTLHYALENRVFISNRERLKIRPLTPALSPAKPGEREKKSGLSDWEAWALAGLCGGLAILSKFTSLLFLPVAAIAMFALASATGCRVDWRRAPGLVMVYAVLAFAVVWSMYGFSLGTLGSIRVSGEYRFDGFPTVLENVVVPAPEFVAGLIWAKGKVETGHSDYFLGECDTGGSWFFFPLLLMVKTPIPMLLFAIAGSLRSLLLWQTTGRWQIAVPLTLLVAMLLSVLPSTVNLGVRHVLPLYPLLALIAAEGCAAINRFQITFMRKSLWHSVWQNAPAIVCGLLLWTVAVSFRSHPNYLAYFNELAGSRPERIAIDSDLDWGQGLVQLGEVCRELDIDALQIEYFGTADVDQFELPRRIESAADEPWPRWIAISTLKLYCDPQFSWLKQHEPKRRIAGGAMQLFYVDATRSRK